MTLNSQRQFFPYKTFPIKSTILIVDDRPENLLALEAVLKGTYHLLYATSGREALELLKENEVDVILLDVQMPVMDGYEVARLVKQMPGYRDIPIIFITASFTEDPHIKKGYEVGAIDYFIKPFDPDILKLKVGIYASLRQKDALLREREERIKQSEEIFKAGQKLSAVLQGLPVGVIVADIGGRIVQTNDIVFRICKLLEPIKNGSYGDFLTWWANDGHLLKNKFSLVIESGLSRHNEIIKIKCSDQTSKDVLSSISPLRGPNNHVVGIVAVIQDISEHQKVEKDMEQCIVKLVSLGAEFEQISSK